MRAFEIVSADGIDSLAINDRPQTQLGSRDVRVKIHASSLNYRDLMTVLHPTGRATLPLVPNSDGAGEVVAVGDEVDEFRIGDRVATLFFQRWADGNISTTAMQSALGGALDGVLAEEVTLKADGLIKLPSHLDYAQGATLPCAALTAWHSIVEKGRVKAGDTLLILGTGGVSIFALQFGKILGARTIVTSSSDEKLERARGLGADETINYRDMPDWDDKVLELTDGAGVDHGVEVGGPGPLVKSINASRVGGSIGLIGILTGAGGMVNPTAMMRKSINLHGVYVGSQRMFADMNKAISHHQLHPVIDQTFEFADAPAAFHAMHKAGHFGKIVVTMS
ncbi:MAG: NAD(P)-dependent alcohol dehydrogenase [Gammaproteobacteria bacterium]|nr:NAD(P)-dependent alcohol dehydrogenase [Gammaproteobacteria bacterium]